MSAYEDMLELVTSAIHEADDDDGYIDTDMVPHLENDYTRYESMAKAAIGALAAWLIDHAEAGAR